MKSRDYPLMSKKILLVPKLRFPEFAEDGEWMEKNLGSIGKFVGGGTPSTSESKYWDGNIQWYTPTEVKDGNLKPSLRTITKEGLKDSSAKLLPKGTILVTTRATIGNVAIATQECTTNQGFQSLIVQKSEDNKFWYYWIELHRNEFIRRSSGSTFKEIGKTEIKIIPSLSPAKAEQQKVSSCLSSLDQLIVAQKQKLTALKDHKKGLMQNLFPKEGQKVPHYRFPKFENEGEWVEKSLDDISQFFKGKGISKADIVKNGTTPCIRYGELYTNYNETIKKIKSKTNLPLIDLVLSKANDVIIPASGETQEDIATASCVLDSNVGIGGDLNIIRTNSDGVFLSYYLNNAKKKDIAQISQGISIVHLYSKQLKKLKIDIPSLPEQQKIASCLSSLDQIVTAQSEKVEQLEQHKKGLMQSLFPKP